MVKKILTVTPNPALDTTMVVPNYTLGSIHRPKEVVDFAGGKGLNVARTIKRLQGNVLAYVLLAGYNGERVKYLLDKEDIPVQPVWGRGETRTCVSIVDPQNNKITETYPPGQKITSDIWQDFETGLEKILINHKWITISGSLPSGAPLDGYTRLLEIAKSDSRFCLIDTHGEPLKDALKADPYLVKINASEAREIVGYDIDSPEKAIIAAQEIRLKGASIVIITMGKIGAVAVSENESLYATLLPEKLFPRKIISPVGSGDALLGGVVLSLSKEESLKKALYQGVAAGTANVLTIGAGNIEKTVVDDLMKDVVITKVQ